ncbi:MAG TPA: PTS sugar transporter subunit IIA [Thermoanaerobaculia bacterium]|nr:PTS sugar transporter subunit IIA [Thermoanaerobaculia bacterium]
MIGKLILTHGGLARELLAAARTINGELAGFEALALDWNDSFEEARLKVRAAVERLNQGQGVLILTDMFGSTPCNVALTFLDPGKVEVLTGVNLPMVLRLACQGVEDTGVADAARWLQAKAQRSICMASDMAPQRQDTLHTRLPKLPGGRG